MFFQIDQDSEGITVSLECLENLLACANELLTAWRETRGDADVNGVARGCPLKITPYMRTVSAHPATAPAAGTSHAPCHRHAPLTTQSCCLTA